jgi:hypothetical protein
MNHLQKHLSASLIALAALVAAPMAMAAPASLLSNFAILSAAPINTTTNVGTGAVTCTNGSIVGDVGSSGPLTSVTLTSCPVTGAIIAPVSAGVVDAFNTALANGLATTCGQTLTGTLAGVTLSPGVYCFDAAATLTGTLTLDGTGTYTFIIGKSGTGALTGTGFNVVLINGAVPCDVTWYVAQAATLTDSNFVGTIYAGADITSTRGTFNGDALSAAGVTVTGTAVIGCTAKGRHTGELKEKCNQGVGNGSEGCDPGNSDKNPWGSNDENDGNEPGHPGRRANSEHHSEHHNDNNNNHNHND